MTDTIEALLNGRLIKVAGHLCQICFPYNEKPVRAIMNDELPIPIRDAQILYVRDENNKTTFYYKGIV